jgi:hypothetical protein
VLGCPQISPPIILLQEFREISNGHTVVTPVCWK